MSRNPPPRRPARRARREVLAAREAKARDARALAGHGLPDAATLARWRAEMVATRGWGALVTPAAARRMAAAGAWRFDVDMTACTDGEVAELWRRARYDLHHEAPSSFDELTRLCGGADAARRVVAREWMARGRFVPAHLRALLAADDESRGALAGPRGEPRSPPASDA